MSPEAQVGQPKVTSGQAVPEFVEGEGRRRAGGRRHELERRNDEDHLVGRDRPHVHDGAHERRDRAGGAIDADRAQRGEGVRALDEELVERPGLGDDDRQPEGRTLSGCVAVMDGPMGGIRQPLRTERGMACLQGRAPDGRCEGRSRGHRQLRSRSPAGS